jgi:hypothetical protein
VNSIGSRVELRRSHPLIAEEPMTEERLPLAELLAKAGDGDFLLSVAEAVLQMLMEADVEGLIVRGATSAPASG